MDHYIKVKLLIESGLKVEKAKLFSFKKPRKNLKTFSIFCKKGDFKGNLYWVNVTLSHQKKVWSYWLDLKSKLPTKFYSQPKHPMSSKHLFRKWLRCSLAFDPCQYFVSLKILSLTKHSLQKWFWQYWLLIRACSEIPLGRKTCFSSNYQ